MSADQAGYAADRYHVRRMRAVTAPRFGPNRTALCDGIGEAGCHHYG